MPKTVVFTKKITNCLDCPHSEIQADPDPNDWFCDDDQKVVCKKARKNITIAARPYQLRRECEVPKWCPLG